MADNVEQIEARLCAYIDGLLSEAERTEIDTHLAANPSHQVMIRELCAQRQWLVSLPREKAPADLAEPLQNQLERESLLRQDMVIEFSQSHFGRRQLLSAAAILLLSAGLGIMVYSFLPRYLPGTLTHMSVTQKPLASAPRPDAAVARNDVPAPVVPVPNVAPAAADTPTAGTTFAFRGADSSVNGAVVLQEDPFFGNQRDAQTVLVAIRTEDLKVASDQLKHYLSSNNIAWTPGDAQMRATIGETPGGAMVGEIRPEAQAMARNDVGRGMAHEAVSPRAVRETPEAKRIILARNLTSQQLSALTSAISALPEVQEQELKDVAVGRQAAIEPETSDLLRNLQYLMPRSDPALHDLLVVPTTQADAQRPFFGSTSGDGRVRKRLDANSETARRRAPFVDPAGGSEKQRASAYNLVILIENAPAPMARPAGANAAVGIPSTQPR